jgi:hypothetical protein
VQKYPVKASHRVNLVPERLEELCRVHFGAADRADGRVATHYGAISSLRAWGEGREIAVELTMDPKVDEIVAGETIRRYNRFLEETTGYSSKERAKRLRKTAGG